MPVARAVSAYTQERLNCAQSVLKGFQVQHGLEDAVIDAANAHGHGRVPGGLCGALHAALQLAADVAQRERIVEAFVSRTGSQQCREIRRARRVSCVECVQVAASLIAGDSATQAKEPV